MKLATQDRSFFGDTFEEKLRSLQSLGYDGLEIDGRRLIERFDEIQDAVRSTGTAISSVCGGYRGWIGAFDAEDRHIAVKDIGEILRYTAEIGAAGVIVPAAFGIFSRKLPPFTPPRSEADDQAVLLEALGQIDKLAEEAGSLLLLEPLNRYEDHMINRLDQAAAIIRKGGLRAVKVMADFFHMNIEEKHIPDSIRATGALVRHVHLADSNRQMPGRGHTDFRAGFGALKEVGFDGYMAIECEVEGDGLTAYRESAAFLRGCLA